MKTNVILPALLAVCLQQATAQTWIWYPGDFEIWLGNEMNNRRTDRGAYFPPFWKQDSHYVTVEFSTEVSIATAETIRICTEGKYNVKIDGKMLFGMPKEVTIEPGRHKINIKVHNQSTPPALFVDGRTIKSSADWKVTYEDKEWIDESGKASDTSATTYMQAGSWNFDTPDSRPSQFKLRRTEAKPVSGTDGLYDFGKETFGFLKLNDISGKGSIDIFYGESAEEANDPDHCETLDHLAVENGSVTDLATNDTCAADRTYTLDNSKAFRFVRIKTDGDVRVGSVAMDYEFMPEQEKGTFRCNDPEVNKMWDVGVYTLQLTTREFFIDGIKRDRWVWSGDASQSYLMNYYLFNDNEEVKRTTWLLGGKAPVTSHINTIMDYTLYWFISIYDYYLYSGDRAFLTQIHPVMTNYFNFLNSRLDADGMLQGMTGDWVFVDWADKPMDKHGQLSFEQILFCQALEAYAKVSGIVGDKHSESLATTQAKELRDKLLPFFWDESRKAIVHNRLGGVRSEEVFKFSNMFAILFDILDAQQQKTVLESVMLNDSILKITTPYMRFYEMEALCKMGEQKRVLREMKDYWGGMLAQGATTFWEKYNPSDSGSQHLAMYGRPYGKSLCHAWGASPIYLLGKYFLGVKPTKPGYEEYEVRPTLGGLKWMEGDVPTPFGKIHVRREGNKVTVLSDGGRGTLYAGNAKYDIPVGKALTVKVKE